MILVLKFDYRSSSQLYEKIFLRTLESFSLKGEIVKNHFDLRLYVEASTVQELESFSTQFSQDLPHSIFLHNMEAEIVNEMPSSDFVLDIDTKMETSFCPKCLAEVNDSESPNYFNVFLSCQVCGYGVSGDKRSYKSEFEEVANQIKEGKVVELHTFYGRYCVGLPTKIPYKTEFDILAYDLATIEKYANVYEHELQALGSFEKPLIKLKVKPKFLIDFDGVDAKLLRFKLPDDLNFHLLMEVLHTMDINALFITKEQIPFDLKLALTTLKKELSPIEVTVAEKDIVIVDGEKGLPKFPLTKEFVVPQLGAFNSLIKEHNLQGENIASIYLSKEHKSNIIVYGDKFGLVEYLSFNFEFYSISEIFDKISDDDNAAKLVANYKKKFFEHYEKIIDIEFEDPMFSIYRFWGVVAIILGYTDTRDPDKGASILEESASEFLGTKGPRIDYKLITKDGKATLDPLMIVRTAMSFKLADVDQLTLCYGVVESFLEFIGNELDDIKDTMDTTAVTMSGSMLSNRHIFSKVSKEISINNNIYFNNELPISGRNVNYGGNEIKIQ